jgi:glycine/D-amino acid oxidase-like deaminating enzyme
VALIGPVPGNDGVFAATGHGTLGLTLAPGTAEHLTPLVLGGRSARLLEPFSLTRWT